MYCSLCLLAILFSRGLCDFPASKKSYDTFRFYAELNFELAEVQYLQTKDGILKVFEPTSTLVTDKRPYAAVCFGTFLIGSFVNISFSGGEDSPVYFSLSNKNASYDRIGGIKKINITSCSSPEDLTYNCSIKFRPSKDYYTIYHTQTVTRNFSECLESVDGGRNYVPVFTLQMIVLSMCATLTAVIATIVTIFFNLSDATLQALILK